MFRLSCFQVIEHVNSMRVLVASVVMGLSDILAAFFIVFVFFFAFAVLGHMLFSDWYVSCLGTFCMHACID